MGSRPQVRIQQPHSAEVRQMYERLLVGSPVRSRHVEVDAGWSAPPGLGQLLSRLAPPSPKSMLRLASAVGEKATLARHPDLVDLLVAAGRDPITDRAAKAEFHALISPFALLSPSGFRRRACVRPDELRQLAMPTLVLWGERDPVGSVPVAQALADLIPDARLEVLPTGHGPWLGQSTRTAAAVADFMRRTGG